MKESDEIIRGDGNSQNEREFLEGLKIMLSGLDLKVGSIKTQTHLFVAEEGIGAFLEKRTPDWQDQ